ncbi:grim [Cochliomyia hominivorax]
MAIAYFIPDQAKLLAGQRSNRGNSNATARSSNNNNNQTSSRLPPSNQGNESAPVNSTVNRGYGTTINITVPTLNTTPQEPLGCWDFLTQVFCHALRFYHESSQLQPTVIQISVNFNSQTTATNSTTTPDTTATTTRNQQQTTPTAETTRDTSSEEQRQTKFSKRKN